MAENKKYWRGVEELTDSNLTQELSAKEFPTEIPTDEFLGNKEALEESSTSRRDFLKYMGFSTAAATLAACETPISESIPYVIAPEEIIPGVANYYATSFYDGHDFASILVKTREGRPIKVEHNKMAAINGGANARIHASVLNLYDATRMQSPMVNGEKADWSTVNKTVKAGLDAAEAGGKQIVMLTSTVISPSAQKLINEFGAQYSNFKHVSVDAFSFSGKLDAHKAASGTRALPLYHFNKAKVIASFGADFLGDWIGQSVAGDYATTRKPGKGMSRHIQFESNLSLTGSSADKRYKLTPTEMNTALVALYNELSGSSLAGGKTNFSNEIKSLAKELKAAGNEALVVSGSNNKDVESLTIAINQLLANEGTTISNDHHNLLRKGNDTAFNSLVADMNAGSVGAVLMDNVNPVYHFANNDKVMAGLKKVKTSVYFTEKNDETAQVVSVVCAKHNFLESWGDAMPATGHYALQQPTIQPLFDTKQMEDCLMAWSGNDGDYLDYMKANWGVGILGSSDWSTALHDGVLMSTTAPVMEEAATETESSEEEMEVETTGMDVSASASNLSKIKGAALELAVYQKSAMGTGNLANNPWLQELPDPISRVTWDNYLTVSAADALELGIENRNVSNGALNGSKVNITVNGKTIEGVPALIQPGQAKGTMGLALGYGRQGVGKVADAVGVNAFALMKDAQHTAAITVDVAEGEHEFACTQLAHTMMGRKIVNETTLDTFLNESPSNSRGDGWNQKVEYATFKGPMAADEVNLWDDFDHETGHMWNMSIDLNMCNGCGACVIACHAENNVPVVGKEEVRKSRDMHWLRIDRYYSSDMTEEVAEETGVSSFAKFDKMEDPSASPDVFFQPVMCQHCNHAPCETVCPVAATTHSNEGLNHMAYNRCIGTRYCANNCPYKVRRFNWFQYHDGSKSEFDINYSMNDDLGRMVLNPDVTVRSRGVMEKCSLCVQRIQLGKLEAKKAGRPVKDGDVTTACQSACDTGAISFGDVNDHNSEVFELKKDKRMYHLLEEVGTQPSIFYQTKVRNRA